MKRNFTLKSFMKDNVYGLLLSFLVIINYFFPLTCEPTKAIDVENTSALNPICIEKTATEKITKHNELLREYLLQRISIENSRQAMRESTHQQMRGFYILIIAGLLSILIAKYKSTFPFMRDIVMIIIAVMYLLEVHQLDMYQRFNSVSDIYTYDVYRLINPTDNSRVWYVLSYEQIRDQMNKASNGWIRWRRKLLKALKPSTQQIALYVFPFVALFWWRFKRDTQFIQKPKKRLLIYGFHRSK